MYLLMNETDLISEPWPSFVTSRDRPKANFGHRRSDGGAVEADKFTIEKYLSAAADGLGRREVHPN